MVTLARPLATRRAMGSGLWAEYTIFPECVSVCVLSQRQRGTLLTSSSTGHAHAVPQVCVCVCALSALARHITNIKLDGARACQTSLPLCRFAGQHASATRRDARAVVRAFKIFLPTPYTARCVCVCVCVCIILSTYVRTGND